LAPRSGPLGDVRGSRRDLDPADIENETSVRIDPGEGRLAGLLVVVLPCIVDERSVTAADHARLHPDVRRMPLLVDDLFDLERVGQRTANPVRQNRNIDAGSSTTRATLWRLSIDSLAYVCARISLG